MEIKDKMLNESESGKMSKQRRFTEQLLEKQTVEKSSNIISPQVFKGDPQDSKISCCLFIWHSTRGTWRTRENKMQIICNFGCTNCLSCLFSAKYKQN